MRKDEAGLQKHTLNLHPGDYEKLGDYYPEFGAGPIIRRIVRAYIQRIEANGGPVDVEAEIKI